MIYNIQLRCFRKIQEELQNDYVKGNTSIYPEYLVKTYQLLNDFKSSSLPTDIGNGSGIGFSQTKKKKNGSNGGTNTGKREGECTVSGIRNPDTYSRLVLSVLHPRHLPKVHKAATYRH